MLHVSLSPAPRRPPPTAVVGFCLIIYGFAHTLQSEAWHLSEGALAGFIGFDPPTASIMHH